MSGHNSLRKYHPQYPFIESVNFPLDVRYCNMYFVLLKPSVFELVRIPDFANLPLIVEDFVKDSGGSYTGRLLPIFKSLYELEMNVLPL